MPSGQVSENLLLKVNNETEMEKKVKTLGVKPLSREGFQSTIHP